MGGGFVFNYKDGKKWSYFTNHHTVGGPIQFFRRKCWEDIGGYFPGGHLDYFAEVGAIMKGWEVRSFPDLAVYHHKHPQSVGVNRGKLQYYSGQMDYICGELFPYSFLRSLTIMMKKPLMIGGILRIMGYVFIWLKGEKKQVPDGYHKFMKNEQIRKIMRKFRRCR